MRFLADGPDIPEPLLRAQRRGEVMFVIGAGISKNAKLPLFGELAERIYTRIGQGVPGTPHSIATSAEDDAHAARQYDRLIGLLERRVVLRRADWHQPTNIVRDAAARELRPRRGADLTVHRDLLDLSRGLDGAPRVVTTNFDTLLERAWLAGGTAKLPSHAGAAIPRVGSPDFSGVLHLHGRVADRKLGLAGTELVLTASDFGDAYLGHAWATRLVHDLLRRYTLVLVGYRADDPPVRYILEATQDERVTFPDLRQPYAFVPTDGSDEGSLRERWQAKGLQPIVYDAGGGHGPLNQTLEQWAALMRDPLGWSRRRIGELVSVPANDATEAARRELVYLASEVSSLSTVSEQAADPAWITAMTEQGFEADDWSYLVWLRERLSSATTSEFAVNAPETTRRLIAQAVRVIIEAQHGTPEPPFDRFWPLFVRASDPQSRPPRRWRRREGSGAGNLGDTGAFLRSVVPRLTVKRRFRWPPLDAGPPGDPSLHDLADFELECPNDNWRERLDGWPADGVAEADLLGALDRGLQDTVSLAREADLLQLDGDFPSHDVTLVADPEADDGLIEPGDRHARNWRMERPDGHNNRLAPLLRSITGLWRRLLERDPDRAVRFARDWAEREEPIFLRLAAWAATLQDGPAFELVERHLARTTPARYWFGDQKPELVRFYCRRWPDLRPATRRVIERAIIGGPPREFIAAFNEAGHRRAARSSYVARELVRIVTAGGALSASAAARLARFRQEMPQLPGEMPVFARLVSLGWSGSGYSANVAVLADVPDEELIGSASRLEEHDRWGQQDLWPVFVRDQPIRAFQALGAEAAHGRVDAMRWHPFLSLYGYRDPSAEERSIPSLKEVTERLLEIGSEPLRPLLRPIATTLQINAGDLGGPGIPELWDMALDIAIREGTADVDGDALAEQAMTNPISDLARALIHAQDVKKGKQDGGFDPLVAPRLDALVGLPGRLGLIARAALCEQLAFLSYYSPGWVRTELYPFLLAGDDISIDLMGVVAHSDAMRRAPIFNDLKPSLIAALESAATETRAAEALSMAIVVAAFARYDGMEAFQLTPVEARRVLTRMPNEHLASLAWDLASLLRQERERNPASYWRYRVSRFLAECWPNDVAVRTEGVTGNLGHLPGLAGDAFPEAVDTILELTVPIRIRSIAYGLDLDHDAMRAHPRAALRLLVGLLDVSSPAPDDLADALAVLVDADPSIAAEPGYWRLRQLARPE